MKDCRMEDFGHLRVFSGGRVHSGSELDPFFLV